ncbi:MAG TPA: cellulose biosynthesis protein BcsS [Bradyrhizobium sp.]|nr:cellulose biosynthesis protein BcsS [Bradyrhizobium sp.]
MAAAIMTGGTGVLAQTLDETAPALPASEPSGGAKPEHFLLYSGFDIWRFGRAGYGGFYAAPEGLGNDGFVARLFASEGRERYDFGAKRYSTDILRLSLSPGWRLSQGGFELKVFAGPELESASRSATHIGALIAAETWWEPLRELALSSSFSATTNVNAWSARGAASWRVRDQFWVGPEILASGDIDSKQYRVGAHLTGFRLAAFEWSLAAGVLQDSFHRSGVYGRIGVSTGQ